MVGPFVPLVNPPDTARNSDPNSPPPDIQWFTKWKPQNNLVLNHNVAIAPNKWVPVSVDRPAIVIQLSDSVATLVISPTNPEQTNNGEPQDGTSGTPKYVPGSAGFLPHAGKWFLGNSSASTTLTVLIVDASAPSTFHPVLNQLFGYDASQPGRPRAIASTREYRRAALYTAIRGGAVLADPTWAHTQPSIGVVSSTALAANTSRVGALFVNDSVNTIYLRIDGAVSVVSQGIRINAGGGSYQIDGMMPYRGIVTAISTAAASALLVSEATEA